MVVGVCQKKRQCKFNTDPKTFQGDPCPGLRKYIEVAYKCRPCKYSHTCRCTYTYVRTDACANVRGQMWDRVVPSGKRERIVFLRDIRFLFMRTSSVRLARRSHKNQRYRWNSSRDTHDGLAGGSRGNSRARRDPANSDRFRWLREYLLRVKT